MSVNIDGNINQINTENSWFQNWKNGNSQEKEKDTLQPKTENAVKITFSRDGMESYRKKLQESGKNEENGKVIVKPAALKQASKAIFENHYNCELTKEVEKLKEQRISGSTYSLSNKAEDYVRAYGNLYDEIVQSYQNGTREIYVEDKNSETGFRKLTMEEELSSLDKAFQQAADREDAFVKNAQRAASAFKQTAEKLSKYKDVKTGFADAYKKLEAQGITEQENFGQKIVTLAQTWKDSYKASASKHNSMEKVLSIMNDMFHINSKA